MSARTRLIRNSFAAAALDQQASFNPAIMPSPHLVVIFISVEAPLALGVCCRAFLLRRVSTTGAAARLASRVGAFRRSARRRRVHSHRSD